MSLLIQRFTEVLLHEDYELMLLALKEIQLSLIAGIKSEDKSNWMEVQVRKNVY